LARAPARPGQGVTPGRGIRGRGLVGYFRSVWDELRKVIWPTRNELWRMTWVVVATVIVFGLLIGAADAGFGALTEPLLFSGPSASASAAPAATPAPATTAPPSASPATTSSPSAGSSATASPTP
jgi:preprotein translocase SecE subunit